jgi:hypothetical protein
MVAVEVGDAEKRGIDMPPELVGNSTQNLFDNSSSASKLHTADQFTDLLKQVSFLESSKGSLKVTRSETKPDTR